MHIIDLWQYCVCCIRLGVTRWCSIYLCRMCQCGIHVVLWSHNYILMRLLVVEPRSTEGLLFHSQQLCGTILLTLCSIVWDIRVSRASPTPFYWPSCLLHFCRLLFPILFFLSMGWHCGAGISGLIGCKSLSPSIELQTVFKQ